MSKLILCTVGTSLFEPGKYKGDKLFSSISEFNRWIQPELMQMRKTYAEEIHGFCGDKEIADNIIKCFVDRLPQDGSDFYPSALSAEMASLIMMTRYRPKSGEGPKFGPVTGEDRLVFLFSDTPEGGFSAYLNAAITAKGLLGDDGSIAKELQQMMLVSPDDPSAFSLDDNIFELSDTIHIVRIPGLKVDTNESFKSAVHSLISTIGHYNEGGYDQKLLNFTGGYKGTVPIAATYCWACEFVIYFLHEKGDEIIFLEAPLDLHLDMSSASVPVIYGGDKSGEATLATTAAAAY